MKKFVPMKTRFAILIIAQVLTGVSCASDVLSVDHMAPYVSLAPVKVTEYSKYVTLSASVSNPSQVREVEFYVSESKSMSSATRVASTSSGKNVSVSYLPKEYGKTYYAKAVISNGKDKIFSSVESFTTLEPVSYINLSDATIISRAGTSATVSASLQAADGATPTSKGFCYGSSEAVTLSNNFIEVDLMDSFTAEIPIERSTYVRAFVKYDKTVIYSKAVYVYVPTMQITASDITYRGANVTFIPSDNKAYYIQWGETKEFFDNYIKTDSECISYILRWLSEKYGESYSEYGCSSYEQFILDKMLRQGEDTWQCDDLNPETEYYFLSFFLDQNLNAISPVSKILVKAGVKPNADPRYDSHIGRYNFEAYDKKNEKIECVLEIEEDIVNDTYQLSFPDGKVTPRNVSGVTRDYFVCRWDKNEDTISLVSGTFSGFGFNWIWNEDGDRGGFYVEFEFGESSDPIGKLSFSFDDNGNMILKSPEVPAEEYIRMKTMVYSESNPSLNGEYSRIDFKDGMLFTKQAAASSIRRKTAGRNCLESPNCTAGGRALTVQSWGVCAEATGLTAEQVENL